MNNPLPFLRFLRLGIIMLALCLGAALAAENKPPPDVPEKTLTPAEKSQLDEVEKGFKEAYDLSHKDGGSFENREEAAKQLRAMLLKLEKLVGPEDRRTLKRRLGLAEMLRGLKEDEALGEYRAVIAIKRRLLGQEAEAVMWLRNDFATILNDEGKFAKAEQELRAIFPQMEQLLGSTDRKVLERRLDLAFMLDRQGKNKEADKEYRAIFDIALLTFGPADEQTMHCWITLIEALCSRQKHDAALAEYRKFLAIQKKAVDEKNQKINYTAEGLAGCLAEHGHLKDAIAVIKERETAYEKRIGPQDIDTEHYRAMWEDYRAMRKRMEAKLKKQPPRGPIALDGSDPVDPKTIASFDVKVVDEGGKPMVKVPVEGTFDWNGGVQEVTKTTGKWGTVHFESATENYPEVECSIEGYYKSTLHVVHDGQRKGYWKMINPNPVMVMRRIVNPVPMYVVNQLEIEMPRVGKAAFDLQKQAWVAPDGKGEKPDLVFTLERKGDEKQGEATLKLTFSNPGDGLVPVPKIAPGGSEFQFPREAPAIGYQPGRIWHRQWVDGDQPEITRELNILTVKGATAENLRRTKANPPPVGYFFRVRTVLNEKGEVVSALYAKMLGETNIIYRMTLGREFNWEPNYETKTARIKLTYCLNPDGTRNLEFDVQRNLFKDLDGHNMVVTPW